MLSTVQNNMTLSAISVVKKGLCLSGLYVEQCKPRSRGGIKRCPEDFWTGGGIEKLFFQIYVNFVLPKINQKG